MHDKWVSKNVELKDFQGNHDFSYLLIRNKLLQKFSSMHETTNTDYLSVCGSGAGGT